MSENNNHINRFIKEMPNNIKEVPNKIKELPKKVADQVQKNLKPEHVKWIGNNKVTIVSVIFITILFIFISRWAYETYVTPFLNKQFIPNKEFIKEKENKKIRIYYFYTTWCPYCKKAKPEWEEFTKNIQKDNLLMENYDINFIEVDAEKDTSLAKEFKIDSYPSIKMLINNKIYNYDAKPNSEHLTEFFKGSL